MYNKDIEGVVRFIAAYGKGKDSEIVYKYYLENVVLQDLREIFDISENDPDPGTRDLIDCYPINSDQFQLLKKYLKTIVIDVNDYDLYLECSQELFSDWNILSKKYGYYPPPSDLLGFTEAIPIKPSDK